MQVSVTLNYKMDPGLECIRFFSLNFACPDKEPRTMERRCRDLAKEYSIPLEELQQLVAPLLLLEQELTEVLTPRRELWDQMFYENSEDENALAWGFYMLERQTDLRTLPLPLLRKRLVINMLSLEQENVEQVDDLESLLRLMEEVHCSPRTKLACMHVWQEPLAFYDKYRALVDLTEGVLRRHEAALEERIAAAVRVAEQTLAQDLDSAWTEMGVVRNSEKLVVIPMCYDFNGQGICWDDSEEDSPAIQFVGILKEEITKMQRALGNTAQLLAEQLKTISDQRRLEILMHLKNGTLCGQELVGRLCLTPGTVSHHMNSLVRDGFVGVSKAGVKINYRLQRDKVEAFLDLLRSVLLE